MPKTTTSVLPKVWVGFIFAGTFLFVEAIELSMGNEGGTGFLTSVVAIGGVIYWLFCVHRFHRILRELSATKYPISPGRAVGYHFIPIYSLYWIFKWPIEFSKFINSQEFVRMVPGGLLGFLLLLSTVLYRTVDGALGLVCIFGISTYMASKLQRYKQIREKGDNSSDKVIITCPNEECQQQLILPKVNSTLFVTCPKCRANFKYPLARKKSREMGEIRWWHRGWFVIPMLIFFAPIGFIFLWNSPKYRRPTKIGLTLCFTLLYLGSYLSMTTNQWAIKDILDLYENKGGLIFEETYIPKYRGVLTKIPVYVRAIKGQFKSIPQIIRENEDSVVLIEALDENNEVIAQGSGFILNNRGFLATNYHVIARAYSGKIKFLTGEVYKRLSLITLNKAKDIAILKIEGKSFPHVFLGDSDKIEKGEKVIAIGNPLGLEASASEGIVSGVRDKEGHKYIQTTAPISMGSSGGPLFNKFGEVIGITTSTIPGLFGQNLNFAVPINYVKELLGEKLEVSLHISDEEKSYGIESVDAITYNNRGDEYADRGMYDEAIREYKQALTINSDFIMARVGLGIAYLSKGLIDEATVEFEKAIKIRPQSSYTHFFLGLSYLEKGMHEQALSRFKRAVEINPDDAVSQYKIALIYEAIDRKKAFEQWKKYLQIAKGNPDEEEGISMANEKVKNWARSFSSITPTGIIWDSEDPIAEIEIKGSRVKKIIHKGDIIKDEEIIRGVERVRGGEKIIEIHKDRIITLKDGQEITLYLK
jgi:S1-C subfamily serine protease